MARRYRRKTFWRQAQGAQATIEAANFGTPTVQALDGVNSDASLSLYTRDAVPTLVGILGTLIVTGTRSDSGNSPTPNTQAAIYGVGINCYDYMGISVASDPLTELEDEMWLWTTAGRLEAATQAQAYWNSQANAETTAYRAVFTAPYPNILSVRSRARRKFEDPCSLWIHFNVEEVDGLETFDDVSLRWYLRTLWMAA